MNTMQLFIVVMALICIALIAAITHVNRTRKGELVEIAGLFMPALGQLVQHADNILVPYGDRLKPLHDVATFAGALTDDPNDWLVKLIANATGKPAPMIIDFLKQPLEQVTDLLDGEPETVQLE